jgi:hypothetical protein
MPQLMAMGPYSKASWPVIVQQFEKATEEMALPFDAAEYLRALVEDGHSADVGESVAYEAEEAVEAVETAELLVTSVSRTLDLAFALGYRELHDLPTTEDDREDEAITAELMPVVVVPQTEPPGPALPFNGGPSGAPTDPALTPVPFAAIKTEIAFKLPDSPKAEPSVEPPKAEAAPEPPKAEAVAAPAEPPKVDVAPEPPKAEAVAAPAAPLPAAELPPPLVATAEAAPTPQVVAAPEVAAPAEAPKPSDTPA